MFKRFFSLSCVAGILLTSLPAQQPNFLIIMTDDVDVAAFQSYATAPTNTADGASIATPHLDTLASEGLRLTNAFTTPLCTPT